MKTGRLIGRMFLTLSLILIGHEVLNALESGEYRLIALGELWFRLDRAMGTGSLNISQAIVQRYISPWLWEGVFQNVLTAPGWLVFGVPGAALARACRHGRRSSRTRRKIF